MLLMGEGATSRETISIRPENDPHVRAAWKALLGRLINDGARLRFFPHRVMMFVLLARDATPAERHEFLGLARDTLTEWQRIAHGIGGQHDLIEVDPALSDWLNEHMAPVATRYEHICRHFSDEAEQLVSGRVAAEQAQGRIVALSRFVATDLLACMNELVASFETELTDTAERTSDITRQVLAQQASTAEATISARQLAEQLNQVNGKVQMISLNALIEASRAGEAGQVFGAVAQEIKALSAEIGSLVKRMQADLGR